MAEDAKPTLSPAEMEAMSPQASVDAIDAATARSWDDVPEPFRSEVLAVASTLGEQRRQRA
jgi:hypothetical protein